MNSAVFLLITSLSSTCSADLFSTLTPVSRNTTNLNVMVLAGLDDGKITSSSWKLIQTSASRGWRFWSAWIDCATKAPCRTIRASHSFSFAKKLLPEWSCAPRAPIRRRTPTPPTRTSWTSARFGGPASMPLRTPWSCTAIRVGGYSAHCNCPSHRLVRPTHGLHEHAPGHLHEHASDDEPRRVHHDDPTRLLLAESFEGDYVGKIP